METLKLYSCQGPRCVLSFSAILMIQGSQALENYLIYVSFYGSMV